MLYRPKAEEVTAGSTHLHNELIDLYSTPHVVVVVVVAVVVVVVVVTVIT
jgi:hypothetical protein